MRLFMSRKQHSPSSDNIPGIIVTGYLGTGAFFFFFHSALFSFVFYAWKMLWGLDGTKLYSYTTPQPPI